MSVESRLIDLAHLLIPIAGALFASAMTLRISLATIKADQAAIARRLEEHVKNLDAHITREFMVVLDQRFTSASEAYRRHLEHEMDKMLVALKELKTELQQSIDRSC